MDLNNEIDLHFSLSSENDSISKQLNKNRFYNAIGMTNIPEFGYSKVKFSSKFSKLFIANWPIYYDFNKFRYTFRWSIVDLDISENINASWTSNTGLETFFHEIGFGYRLINSNLISFTPSIYAGTQRLTLNNSDDFTDLIKYNRKFNYSMDANIAFKVSSIFLNKEKRNQDRFKDRFFYLSLTGSYKPNFYKNQFGINGPDTFLSFGFGWYYGTFSQFKKINL